LQSYLYSAASNQLTVLSALPGGPGLLSAALNNKDQVVGNGFLYSNGTIQTVLSLIPPGSGWSNLAATGINDAGQIVGQGTYDGQQVAFLMTPDAVPEPGTLAVWGLIVSCVGLRFVARCKPLNG
jgi:probable HAF family extracellular repeat protein